MIFLSPFFQEPRSPGGCKGSVCFLNIPIPYASIVCVLQQRIILHCLCAQKRCHPYNANRVGRLQYSAITRKTRLLRAHAAVEQPRYTRGLILGDASLDQYRFNTCVNKGAILPNLSFADSSEQKYKFIDIKPSSRRYHVS